MDGQCRSLELCSLQAPIPLDVTQPATLQDLIDEWHGNARGVQALANPPQKLAFQLKRFGRDGAKVQHSIIMLDSLSVANQRRQEWRSEGNRGGPSSSSWLYKFYCRDSFPTSEPGEFSISYSSAFSVLGPRAKGGPNFNK